MIAHKGTNNKEEVCHWTIAQSYFEEVEPDVIVNAYKVKTDCGLDWLTLYDLDVLTECPQCYCKIVWDNKE